MAEPLVIVYSRSERFDIIFTSSNQSQSKTTNFIPDKTEFVRVLVCSYASAEDSLVHSHHFESKKVADTIHNTLYKEYKFLNLQNWEWITLRGERHSFEWT
jgi:hypothetical protein